MSKRKARYEWFCTDECVRWFGGAMFSPKTGRKYTVHNIQDAANRVRDTFNQQWTHLFKKNPDLDNLVKAGQMYPDLKTPAKTAQFKGKTIKGAKPIFRRKCDEVRKKGDTPLGYIVAVQPTRKEARKEMKDAGVTVKTLRYADEILGTKTAEDLLQTGGTGHAVAVDCEGRIVADTAPEYTKRKKIRRVRQINMIGWFGNWYKYFTAPKSREGRADAMAIWSTGRFW